MTHLLRIDAMAYVIDEQREHVGSDAGYATEAAIKAIRTWTKEAEDQIDAFQTAAIKTAREAAPAVANKIARRSRKAVRK